MLAHETSTERLPVGQRKPIDAAKDLVSILELAERLCPEGARRVGKNMVARCPLLGHDDKTPSFYVYPETGSFWCFGCQRGGDVVHLAAHAWGHGDDMATAAAELLHEFGHEIPQRPQAWFARQERQKPVRDALEEARVRSAHRRLYRIFVEHSISLIEDEDERRDEAERVWNDLLPIARMLLARGGRA
jgi:DNA primase